MMMYVDLMTAGDISAIDFTDWQLGFYLRISKDDKRAGESASITHQRALLLDYVKNAKDFKSAAVREYVDDGLSGATTDREGYTRLMRDVEHGAINCILVKDLSRIGRDMLDVDDLLMNFLVEHNVRFISLGDNYDSFVHPLSVLELAVINLFNQDYLQDLAQKSTSSRYIKVMRGEFVGGLAPFGYKMSMIERNKLAIDEEAAGYVRLIFTLAAEGHKLNEIARILNAQNIPTPNIYKQTRFGKGKWKTVDPENHFWRACMLSYLLRDERYTGKLISKKYAFSESGMYKSNKRAKADWIVVPGAHEAIITEAEYNNVRKILKHSKNGIPADNIFFSKVRCAACGYAMQRTRKYDPVYKCTTKQFTGHYACVEHGVLQSDIEKVALESLKAYLTPLIDKAELKLLTLRKADESKTEIQRKIKAEQQALKLLENSVTKIFTLLATGEMTKEAFMDKKETINAAITRKKAALAEHGTILEALNTGMPAIEAGLTELYSFRALQKLDREMVDLLIDRVLVHSEKEIEIVWYDRY